jgi:hypothetical protein
MRLSCGTQKHSLTNSAFSDSLLLWIISHQSSVISHQSAVSSQQSAVSSHENYIVSFVFVKTSANHNHHQNLQNESCFSHKNLCRAYIVFQTPQGFINTA